MMTIPQKTYKTISADKIIINLVIHQENQTQILLKKLNLQENWKKMMVEQCPFFRFIKWSRTIEIIEHQKIVNLLIEVSDSRSVARK